MMSVLWVVLFVALTGSHFGYGLPVRPTPQTYPQDGHSILEGWASEGGAYAAIPALALVIVAIAFLLGCTWCYRHKDCKPNEGADNQLFTASVSHIQNTPQRQQPPDSGFSEPVNNNVSGEDNNNGPISLREMQNIANNNAGGYIYNENEERNAIMFNNSRDSIILFDPLPVEINVDDPLEPYSEWFTSEHFQRNNLQYLREIGRGWFGRVVVGEIETDNSSETVAVKILNQNASLEDKARFLEESRMYRELRHDHILRFLGKCLEEEPWLLIFELCTVDLQQYLIANRSRMVHLNEAGVPLQLMSDISSALAYLHSHGFTYGYLWGGAVLVRGEGEAARGVLGRYEVVDPQHDCFAPEVLRRNAVYTANSEIWSLGTLIWEVCSWGSIPTDGPPAPPPDPPCPYKAHLFQVVQLCWNLTPEERPSAAQVNALIEHLRSTHAQRSADPHRDLYESSDFEERWHHLKPNSIPKVDEHVAIVHAPSTSAGHFSESEPAHSLTVDLDTAVSRSSSFVSDKDIESQIKSESLTNLHGSLEDVRNIYLTHNETPTLDCNQGNIPEDRSDSSVDPWLKEIIAGSQDDVSYYRDVSDVIKNLDNILNSEKTSSSESSHQASPSRDNLSLDCKKDYPMQSSMVKSPGITNFQNILDTGVGKDEETDGDEELDRDTIGTLSHSFERHSDTASQHTLENLTPDTPMKDIELSFEVENESDKTVELNNELPNDLVVRKVPKLKELCVVSKPSVSESVEEQFIKDCETSCDNAIRTDNERTKSLVEVANTESTPFVGTEMTDSVQEQITHEEMQVREDVPIKTDEMPSKSEETLTKVDEVQTSEEPQTETDDLETVTDDLPTESDETRSKSEQMPTNGDETTNNEEQTDEVETDDLQTETEEIRSKSNELEDKAEEAQMNNENESSSATENIENAEVLTKNQVKPEAVKDAILPIVKQASNETDTLPSVSEEVSNTTEASKLKIDSLLDDIEPETTESENNYSKDETILVSDLVDIVSDSSKDQLVEPIEANEQTRQEMEQIMLAQDKTPALVQKIIENNQKYQSKVDTEKVDSNIPKNEESTAPLELPPATVQNTDNTSVCETDNLVDKELNENNEIVDKDNQDKAMPRSDSYIVMEQNERSSDATVYMDLINNTNSQILTSNVDNSEVRDERVNAETTPTVGDSTFLNESTVYMDLPSFKVIKMTDDFLHCERLNNDHDEDKICTSTPIASDNSETLGTLNATQEMETLVLNDSKTPEYGVTFTRLEQRSIPDSMSPFESPSKSLQHTDTFDENSSVVLGSFENCSTERFKGMKPIEMVELPKEELLAFSSNFSEINLETPSPLRDVNFLNEVPDIIPDDTVFDDITSVPEPKESEPLSDTDGSGPSGTERHVSPSTPPNSPGVFLASTSEPKYVVDIVDLNDNAPLPLRDEIELNQIELHITSKMAMAENENNLNIEYSGPLTVEGLIEEGAMMPESDAIPEVYLAGNGDALENLRDHFSLDEECVKALRNELELKLPLAQVASIDPQVESDVWAAELPPPPELIVNYPGALSPIAEETGQQLSAYENDMQWNPSTRTDSSESYPEPCNNSTDEATELPTGHNLTYTTPSRDESQHTYTVCKDAAASTRDLTMSADRLNGSPLRVQQVMTLSPIDDRTYNKSDDKSGERISQVSPFLVSPTTDTSETEPTRVSTSKTTLPTDAKHSKPETQCLSKATSIDSWCSNDTLYNVEENFDDLALEPDAFQEANSDSSATLNHDENKEHSHCSTYIIHDSKSEQCDSFSPDSITANDNYTYTKVRTEAAGTTPSATEINDSKNTTKDLAYGTLMSGMPSFSNCTTEVTCGLEDAWKLPQPELVRRSPIGDNHDLSPPKPAEDKKPDKTGPIITEHSLKKMDSVEISCLQDSLTNSANKSDENNDVIIIDDSPKYNYRHMTPSVTSTPLTDVQSDGDNCQPIVMHLPGPTYDNSDSSPASLPSFRNFQQSGEIKAQDLSSINDHTNQDTEVLLEGESKTLSRNNIIEVSTCSTNYSDFGNSACTKPQDLNSRDWFSQSAESGVSSEGFRQFENSVRGCPQDLSSLIDASSMLLMSERMSGERAMSSIPGFYDQTNQTNSSDPMQFQQSPPTVANLLESQAGEPTNLLINFGPDDETEQPHSIIVTEALMNASKVSPNRTYDSHTESHFNHTYNSHGNASQPAANESIPPRINGEANRDQIESLTAVEHSPTILEEAEKVPSKNATETSISDLPNGSLPDKAMDLPVEVKVNGNGVNVATVQFLNETFEELIESNVDDADCKDGAEDLKSDTDGESLATPIENKMEVSKETTDSLSEAKVNGETNGETEESHKVVTQDFLQNEKKFCQLDCYLPLLSDIRFTGPATEIMSTSFSQDSPTEPTSPECEQDSKPNTAAEILKEWDSDSDSHSSNSSSGEFIWKDGNGHETSLVPTTHFDHQRGSIPPADGGGCAAGGSGGSGGSSGGSGDSCSGSEGDEVEFVPSSWDCQAEPSKSSLRSLEQASLDSSEKKRVVFKRQKYHCVYEYPREAADAEPSSPAYLPDLSTYSEWDPTSAEEAELCYGHLFSSPSLANYPLRAGIAIGSDYDEDFFISSSARPFESLGVMSSSQFFPGMHLKPSLEREPDDVTDYPVPCTAHPRAPSLDLVTPDSGVEDITPGSTDEDYKKKLPEPGLWKPVDSASSSESVSPSSPGNEALGGLRHTRDKLKLDLPPSPHIPSPRHNRVFSFVLDKPKRRPEERPVEIETSPLIMTDETPVVTDTLPLQKEEELPAPEPTFSTFGKCAQKVEPEQKIILNEVETEEKESPKVVEPVKGEGTVLDSGDEDSGIESSSKATLERNTNVS